MLFPYINTVCLSVLISIFVLKPAPERSLANKCDELITVYHKNGDFNGCVLIAQSGELIYAKAFGYADYTASEKLTTHHQFRLASVSKQFTAMAVMMLKERNKLKYDDPVVKYLRDFPYNKITIRHLLAHTSGVPDYGGLFEREKESGKFEKQVVSNRDVYNLILKYATQPDFNPGDAYQYSNTGYVILALLVEHLSKQSFQEFMANNVFIPTGMKRTYVNPPDGRLKNKDRAKGFVQSSDGKSFVKRDWHYQNGMYGDGGVISTVHDLLLWDRALRSGKLVKKSTLDEAFTQVKLNDGSSREYGFGWSVIKQDSSKIVAHGGGWLGYTSGILRDLSRRQTVIQLCNMPSERLFFQLWDILNGRNVEVPQFVNVTFRINSEVLPDTDSVLITGNHKKLGRWNPSKIKMENIEE
jgi:CubicO group peptidase (beta-lactamase class C family)